MLNPVLSSGRWRQPSIARRRWRLALGLPLASLMIASLAPAASAASPATAGPAAPAIALPNGDDAPSRPPDLVVLQQRLTPEGPTMLGVYGAVADPALPGLWRLKLWQERIGRVTVSAEVVRCDPAAPMRISSEGRQRILRQLNPGGLITPANRQSHLIWWAVCVPRLAGVDPAGLAAEARRLGYSGNLQEQQQILP